MMSKHRFHPPEPTGPDRPPARPPGPAPAPEPPPRDADDLEARLAAWDAAPEWAARAGRRTMRAKLAAGLSGLKHAVRGDSSFFAHAYRGLLIGLIAAILGVGPLGWCLLVLSAAMVLIAELAHSAIDTLARAL